MRLGRELAGERRGQCAYSGQMWQICQRPADPGERVVVEQAGRAAIEFGPELGVGEWRGEAAGGPWHRGVETAAILQHHLDFGRKFALGLVDGVAVDAGIESGKLRAACGLV